MKLFLKYLNGRRRVLTVMALFCLVFGVSFFLYRLPVKAVIYPAVLCACIGTVFVIIDFLRVKHEHEKFARIKSLTDITKEVFPEICEIKDEDYREVINTISREYALYRTENNKKYYDMIDYYTVWAHQIKTPIASMRLHLQNEDSPFARNLLKDLYNIERYVEMVLTFLRLNSDSTDYVFKEYDLDKIVKTSVKKFSREFIDRKLTLVYEPINITVLTDEKWLGFVIEQVLSNALKYTPSGSITVSLQPPKTLRICDTGIGIAPEDLPRIFENGYTGFNGRTDKSSSGIGLYLCRRICNNLGHGITATSTVDVGTTIDIDLSKRKIEIE